MDRFTPIASTLGGLLIGLSASMLLVTNGRIAGISGILGEALAPTEGDRTWRLTFLLGLFAGGLALRLALPGSFESASPGAGVVSTLAGVIVGFGTRLGNGCTSGHSICGIPRFSTRSVAATVVFMASAVATVFVVRHVIGGAS